VTSYSMVDICLLSEFLCHEDGGRSSFRNVGDYLRKYIASHPTGEVTLQSAQWEFPPKFVCISCHPLSILVYFSILTISSMCLKRLGHEATIHCHLMLISRTSELCLHSLYVFSAWCLIKQVQGPRSFTYPNDTRWPVKVICFSS
jgi:hypothetical protein